MSWRKIIVDGQEWKWKCGGEFISIRGPDGHGVNVSITELKHVSPEVVEDMHWDGGDSSARVTPFDIMAYINGNLRPQEVGIDRVAILKGIFHGEVHGDYAGGTLTVALPGKGVLCFNVGKGQSDEEDCWIALNYLKYKPKGYYYRQAYRVATEYPKFKKLITKAILRSEP